MNKKNLKDNNNNMLNELTEFLFGFQRRLSHIIRFNTRPRTIDETVASHSFFVTLYSLILAEILEEKGIKIDKLKTVRRALLHDIEECVAGDLMTHLKQDPDVKKVYDKIALYSVQTSLKKLPKKIRNIFLEEWKEFSKGESKEDWIVEVADDLSGIIYCQEQVLVGNKFFKIILQNYLNRFSKLVSGTELDELSEMIEEGISSNVGVNLDMKYNQKN